jgi:hypothetical protein
MWNSQGGLRFGNGAISVPLLCHVRDVIGRLRRARAPRLVAIIATGSKNMTFRGGLARKLSCRIFRGVRGMRRAIRVRSSTTNDRCEAGHGQITQGEKTRGLHEIQKRAERQLANRAAIQNRATEQECARP